MARFLFLVALAALPLLTGCSKESEPMPAPVYLLDQQWVLLELEGKPVTSSAPGRNATTSLVLHSVGNSNNGQAFCNQYGGRFELRAGSFQLRFGQQGATFATCSNQNLETQYLQLLPKVARYTISNHQLALYDDMHAQPLLVFKAAE